MNENEIRQLVQCILLEELAKMGEPFVPVVSSNRHIHLSQSDMEALFGAGHQLTNIKNLVQPGQFACEETVIMQTAKGQLKLRVVGPVRKKTQIELSTTECIKLGLRPEIRMSGDILGTDGCTLVNGDRSIRINEGVIVAARHVHMSKLQGDAYGLKDGDVISVAVEGIRSGVIGNVIVRCGDGHELEMHIDKEEANAYALKDNSLCRVIMPENSGCTTQNLDLSEIAGKLTGGLSPKAQSTPSVQMGAYEFEGKLLSEEAVISAMKSGYSQIKLKKGTIVTPLSKDTAREKGVKLIMS